MQDLTFGTRSEIRRGIVLFLRRCSLTGRQKGGYAGTSTVNHVETTYTGAASTEESNVSRENGDRVLRTKIFGPHGVVPSI